MLEDSVEGFIATWRAYAAVAEFFPSIEGSPLLECRAGGVIFHVFERTGPYTTPLGRAEVIIHPVAERLSAAYEAERTLEVISTSCLRVAGKVIHVANRVVVVDAGAPLVVGVLGGMPDALEVGQGAAFESLAPVHAFVLPHPRLVSGAVPAPADEL